MENKNNTLLTIIGAATLLVAIVGATFAYFSATSNTVTQDVKTGALKVSVSAGQVSEANIKPVDKTEITDYSSLSSNNDVVELPISVTTTGTTISSTYDIYLTASGVALNTQLDGTTLSGGSLSDLKWALYSKKGDTTSLVNSGDLSGGGAKQNLTDASVPIELETEATTPHTDEYTLFIYIENKDEEQNQLQGMNISATISVDAKQS